jgi:hypothetical protein
MVDEISNFKKFGLGFGVARRCHLRPPPLARDTKRCHSYIKGEGRALNQLLIRLLPPCAFSPINESLLASPRLNIVSVRHRLRKQLLTEILRFFVNTFYPVRYPIWWLEEGGLTLFTADQLSQDTPISRTKTLMRLPKPANGMSLVLG